MSMKVGVLLAVVMAVAVAIEFGVVIDPYETQCFYEQLRNCLHLLSGQGQIQRGDLRRRLEPILVLYPNHRLERPRDLHKILNRRLLSGTPAPHHIDPPKQIRPITELLLVLHPQPAITPCEDQLQTANRPLTDVTRDPARQNRQRVSRPRGVVPLAATQRTVQQPREDRVGEGGDQYDAESYEYEDYRVWSGGICGHYCGQLSVL
jgi:hypothetical protein